MKLQDAKQILWNTKGDLDDLGFSLAFHFLGGVTVEVAFGDEHHEARTRDAAMIRLAILVQAITPEVKRTSKAKAS